SGGSAAGVYGYANGPTAAGVYGLATSGSGSNFGVYGETLSSIGIGVYGQRPYIGLYGAGNLYAGYFLGKVYVDKGIGIGASPGIYQLNMTKDSRKADEQHVDHLVRCAAEEE